MDKSFNFSNDVPKFDFVKVYKLNLGDVLQIRAFAHEVLNDTMLRPYFLDLLRSDLYQIEPKPGDHFIHSLALLRDNGDIDSLVRHLNWLQNDVVYLNHELDNYHHSLKKLDDLKVKFARLKDANNRLKERNAELYKFIVESNLKNSFNNVKKNKSENR